MQAYGSDRVRVADDGRVRLSSRLEKGWQPRVARTMTRGEFPGTAVLWGEAYYEVVDVESLPAGGVCYTLEPWADEHAMRVVDRYDAESEAARLAEHRKAIQREAGRRSANLFGFLTGQLPAAVQEDLGFELGILPAKLTLISVVFELAVVIGIFLYIAQRMVNDHYMPPTAMFITGFLWLEIVVRFYLSYVQKRPIGTTVGLFAYILFYALVPNRARFTSPFKVQKGLAVPITDAPEDVALRDSFMIREPFVTLLSAEEQALAKERFGYDYRRHSYNMAAIILVFSFLGVISSLRTHAVLSGVLAAALTVEQLARFLAFRRGPAPSILGWVARPYVRKLLGVR